MGVVANGLVFRFMPKAKITDSKEIENALHRALIEVFTLKDAGLDLTLASEDARTHINADLISQVKIGQAEDRSGVVLSFPDEAAKAQLIENIVSPVVEPEAEEITAEEEELFDEPVMQTEQDSKTATTEALVEASEDSIAEIKESVATIMGSTTVPNKQTWKLPPSPVQWSKGWGSISLQDPDIKFAVSLFQIFFPLFASLELRSDQCPTGGQTRDAAYRQPHP